MLTANSDDPTALSGIQNRECLNVKLIFSEIYNKYVEHDSAKEIKNVQYFLRL